MSSQSDFLIQFQEKMDKLNAVRSNIQTSIQTREVFASQLKTRLEEVKNRLQELSNLINDLKTKANNLETQINTNTTSIGDKERELQQLKDQVTGLIAERDNLTAKITQQENDSIAKIAQLQAKIDDYEAQLRDLTDKKTAAENQAQSLQNELQSKGDQQAAHAEEIRKLTEETQNQLAEKEAQLVQKITDCETKIAGFEQQIKDKETELATKQQLIDEATGQAQTSAQGLQQQIDSLKAENEQLVQRLIAATEAINQSAEDLQTLMADVPNAQTKQDIETLLNDINQQIEQSIQNIGRAAQGQSVAPQTAAALARSNIDPATNVTLMDIGTQSNVTLPFGALKKMLSEKKSQLRGNEGAAKKYKEALAKLNNINDVSEIENILKSEGVSFKNNQIMGGRRTRKNRKQKGGFTYRSTTRRRSITSKVRRSTSPRRTSRRTLK